MPRTNTRIVFPGPYQAVLEEAPLPAALEPTQVLIKNRYSLISPGTELAMFTQSHVGFGDPRVPWARYPYYPGYASVGQVEAVGAAVEGLTVGDTLVYLGAHQAYGLLDQGDLWVRVPQALPLPWAPFAPLAQIAHTARWVSQAQPGETVAVIGLGLVGNLAAQLFGTFSASVIGLDLIPFRRDLAARVGIGQVCDPGDDLTGTIKAATGGRGADTIVEATGDPGLITPALQAVRPRGEVILLGSPRGSARVDMYHDIHKTGAVLKGAHVGLLPRRATDGGLDRQTVMGQMLELIQAKRLVVEPLISEVISPRQIEVGYRAVLEEKGRVLTLLIRWS